MDHQAKRRRHEWLRNAMEHDDDKGLWAADFPEPHTRHEWRDDGTGLLGGQVDDGALKVELERAFEQLLAIEQARPRRLRSSAGPQ